MNVTADQQAVLTTINRVLAVLDAEIAPGFYEQEFPPAKGYRAKGLSIRATRADVLPLGGSGLCIEAWPGLTRQARARACFFALLYDRNPSGEPGKWIEPYTYRPGRWCEVLAGLATRKVMGASQYFSQFIESSQTQWQNPEEHSEH